jgi:hypothetical protein
MGKKKSEDLEVTFRTDKKVFEETPTRKIKSVILTIEYENPLAYGYPEVCHWCDSYSFDPKNFKR